MPQRSWDEMFIAAGYMDLQATTDPGATEDLMDRPSIDVVAERLDTWKVNAADGGGPAPRSDWQWPSS